MQGIRGTCSGFDSTHEGAAGAQCSTSIGLNLGLSLAFRHVSLFDYQAVTRGQLKALAIVAICKCLLIPLKCTIINVCKAVARIN